MTKEKLFKNRKKVIVAVALIVLLLLSVGIFTACQGKDTNVVFKVGDKSEVVSVVDGKVNLPSDPTKEGFAFRGWYTDEACTKPFDANAQITEGMTVYAYFTPITVKVHVNGEAGVEKEIRNYDTFTASYETDANSQNLTFDGWYIDAGYTTKYVAQDTDNLYARYMASVTFDNGYENVYTTMVQTGTAVNKPENSDVLKVYMDEADLSYVNDAGTAYDFSQKINANTTIKVLWKTPHIKYKKIEGSAKYVAVGFDQDQYETVRTYPCISFLSKNVTVGKDADGNDIVADVATIKGNDSVAYISGCITGARKIMFAEGIEYITGIRGFGADFVTETIELPESLKILENSIWGFENLASCNVPSNIEVIIDCFWKGFAEGLEDISRGVKSFDFDIVIPASAKTVSMVPATVRFAEGSKFFVEGNRVYKQEGEDKILVSDVQANVENNSLHIPEGVTKIHVGVLDKISCDYIYMPSTLIDVEYTVDAADYSTIYDGVLLTQHEYIEAPESGRMYHSAYSIIYRLNNLKYVIFDAAEYPFGTNVNLFMGNYNRQFITYDLIEETKLVFVAEVAEGNIQINVNYVNSMDENDKGKKVLTKATGTILEMDALLAEIGINSDILTITSVEQFGMPYEFGEKSSNQYIEIVYEYNVEGFATSENTDGTLTVTGFNQATAKLLDNGTYIVVIPDEFGGKAITSIADRAFKDVNAVSKVYIGKNVKTIGEEAFMNASNLEFVSITPGGLEVIKRSAFENVGSIKNIETGKWEVNPDMPEYQANNAKLKTAYMIIPIAKLTSVESYAFKSMGIACFMPAKGEEDRFFMRMNFETGEPMYSGAVVGEFFFLENSAGDVTNIIKYTGSEIVEKYSCGQDATQLVNVNVWDVQLVATAVGDMASTKYPADYQMIIGRSMRSFASFMPAFDVNVLRYEVMEGSVYFRNAAVIGIASVVHANAFTDMGITTPTGVGTVLAYTRPKDNVWIQKADIVNQVPVIFEDGWWEGIPNNENTVVAEENVGEYTSILMG